MGRLGRAGASWRRRVDRIRRAGAAVALAGAARVPEGAADAGGGELVIEVDDGRVQDSGIVAAGGGLVAEDLGASAQTEPELLIFS